MDDRVCVPELLSLYEEFYSKFLDWLNNTKYYVYTSKRVARRVIVTLLSLTCCVRPSWFINLVIDPWRAEARYRDWKVPIRDTYLQLFIRNWYLPKNVNNPFMAPAYDPDLHKVTDRHVRRIVREVLGVDTKTVRIACAAKIACEEGLKQAAHYYRTSTWYLNKLLASKTGQLNYRYNSLVSGHQK